MVVANAESKCEAWAKSRSWVWIESLAGWAMGGCGAGTAAGRIVCLECLSGSLHWELAAGTSVFSSAAAIGDVAIVGAHDRLVYVADYTNRLLTVSDAAPKQPRSQPCTEL